ncbi:3-deoxy-manno-octulosonate cytidylyltransferase [Curvibacter sp. RS43]|uniref:3-deoxy-manno-octulosonate cytidylyltransferase n=1 Tax=Curvibacter microcysteis TaxID=3026419 RepID=A0ABT5ME32_9BURK|nr:MULTISPECIES: 3-deoxy-manno-octulosonate cytidylyltransferase [unclassified Curvibacter]MDD0809660.1 3-deoxy-manno-octulosonate cytidylyltransferase [Curvibacter sp. RS43]MDD0814838.1 3-deoxy-manno-octulosonate cytidylyltransferase [Curvibacter sp. HBC28]
MSYTVLIPARLASTRLPDKPLADLAGLPMVVRVARQAALSQAQRVVVAADDARIVQSCLEHQVEAVLTRADHPSGSDRLAEACDLLGLPDDAVVVNVQGDEPLIQPGLIDAVAALLAQHPHASMSTAAHPIDHLDEFNNPNVVKVVLDAAGLALTFSRAPIPHSRDQAGQAWWQNASGPAAGLQPLRHIGIYGYRVGFLRAFPKLPQAPLEVLESLEQMRAVWHGHRIAVHISTEAPGPGVDTPEDLARVRALLAKTTA